ncbi:MAG: aminoglycoside 6-adenylyltransferase [Bacillales bacterium]|jgi:aminoglycoside 6-adenylyltransferase|nr:aminoglycoside 6-adenylyltransferase [Bacillales bacterium]
MRTEQEMFSLILNIANADERIRAVVMNGSRTNPYAIKDIFQDYDIVFVVEETKSFRERKNWIDQFGERLYMQYPEENSYYPSDVENCYGWLIQFTDGNRLDLHVCTLSHVLKEIKGDRLCRILLDKDDCLPNIPEETDMDYWIKEPTERQFFDTCNEYWWGLNNIAKGLWREEVPYVMDVLNYCIRPQLIRMMSWKIGFVTNFNVSIGKSGKYMYKWLEKEKWILFLKTYPSANIKDIWESVFTMCDLFNEIAKDISYQMHVTYNENEANNSLKFLKDVYLLPKDAKEIY